MENFQIIIIVSVLVVQATLIGLSFTAKTKKYASLLTTIGIFGTFLGILIGLLQFNPSDISSSVPSLLGGMRIAFITSVTGLFGYIVVNVLVKQETAGDEAGIEELIEVISEGNKNTQSELVNVGESISALSNAISGESEGSLFNQLMLMRTGLNDRFNDLIKEFREFAEFQAENNTKALVKAIEDVIGDFNTKINEQFGENFKQLNEAVKDLVTWQDNFKNILDKSIEQFNRASESLEKSASLMDEIEKKYQSNMKLNEDVKVVLDSLSKETQDLDARIAEFKNMAESAKNAFPIIQENLEGFTSNFSNSFSTLSENLKTNHELAVDNMNSTNQKMSENLEKTFTETFDQLNNQHVQIMESVNDGIGRMDSALSQELEKSLQSLGDQLATLSGKFVDDYKDLTSKMQKIVSSNV